LEVEKGDRLEWKMKVIDGKRVVFVRKVPLKR
jgi:hypothetical protein